MKDKSWAAEVIADDSGEWYGNAMRFATQAEAEAYLVRLSARWALVRSTRVVQSLEPVNSVWVDGTLRNIDPLK